MRGCIEVTSHATHQLVLEALVSLRLILLHLGFLLLCCDATLLVVVELSVFFCFQHLSLRLLVLF